MTQLASYFLTQPLADWGADTIAAFEQLFAEAVEPGIGAEIAYTLPMPKWQFLCYLCDHKPIVLHGSGNLEIDEFEPRQSNDINEFGNRQAIYAASDGIWPIYFAIVDRDNYVTSLINGCFRIVETAAGNWPSYYFFSINGDALPRDPWRKGMIYLLPRTSFEQQPRQHHQGRELDVAQWASPISVKPLAKLAVGPEDFPFLTQIRPHDPAVIGARARANPDNFPWLDE
ncbi:MAG: hypothetical protein NT075_16450 [Chloroflexi bacterium]|nr:hypothetical protein [Chloroflexota bacterium]